MDGQVALVVSATSYLSVKTPTFYHGLPEVEVSDNGTAFTSMDLESS